MLSINLPSRIFADYHAGKEYTNGTKYRYSIQYNSMSLMPTWIVGRTDRRRVVFFTVACRKFAIYTAQ